MTDTQRLDLLLVSLWNAGFILPAELVPPGFTLIDGELVPAIAVATATAPAPAVLADEVAA